MTNFDFLDFKTIIKYLLFVGLILVAGAYLKNLIAIIFVLAILYFSIDKNLFRALEAFFIWLFISNFFIGQEYVTSQVISKYIAKPYFLLFIIFIYFFNRIPRNLLQAGYLKIWIFFLILSLVSAISQGQSPFVIITVSAFFMTFLILQAKGIKPEEYSKFLNLFIAIAIIQTIVSYLQVSEVITAPVKMMEDEDGNQIEWVAGLDDVASGTFGPAASHITSWFAGLISVFMLLMWASTKNVNYLYVMSFSFLQYATVDSKIIMGVSVLMLIYAVIIIFKEKSKFRLSFNRLILFLFVLSIGAFGFIKAWNSYYEYYGEKVGGTRTDVQSVYENEAKESINIVFANIGDWGKIKGFDNIFHDFIKNNPLQLIWGYGIQGYNFEGKMTYIEEQDTQIMQLDNLTRSRSGLISLFATSGLLGFILFLSAFFNWYRKNKTKMITKYDLISSNCLKIYLPFSLLAAFLYPIEFNSIPLITFSAIISIYIKQSEFYSNLKTII